MKALIAAVVSISTVLVANNCPIAGKPDVTFSKDIKPLIDRKCLPCHVKGGSAPFPLQTYSQVKNRSDLCLRMMLTHMMPPCPTTSEFGEFCEGGGPLSDDEAILLQNWVATGSPEGETTTAIATRPMNGWRLGKPDTILKPAQSSVIPAEGRPYWKAFVIPTKDLVGKNLRAFDFHVDQPLAVRSIVLAQARNGLAETKRAKDGWETGGSLDEDAHEYLGLWSAGYPTWQLPNGVISKLRSEALVVQVLYWPRGKEESGDFQLGLYFSKDSKVREAHWLHLGSEEFSVPAPGSLVLNPTTSLPVSADILAVFPEARFFCTSVRLWANDQLLFATRRWEPYWQGPNQFEQPISLPKSTTLKAEFNYDNDIHMGRNEGRRPRPIHAGTRERDEMCRMHVLYVPNNR